MIHLQAAHVAAMPTRAVATQMSLAVTAGTLSQPITFNVTVRAPAAAGPPVGTVSIMDRGNVLHTLTLAPTTSADSKFAVSQATLTMVSQPGGPAFFFGKHTVTASFEPGGNFAKSTARKTFSVNQPTYTMLANGVKIASIEPGFGAQIQSGQTANVFYSGFLAKNGLLFDDSASHGGQALSYVLGSGSLIAGFDAGTAGMQVGETRIIQIPASQGYGSTARGSIPANSTLVFVVTLESIS
jgi:hypothetical protein